MRNSGMGRQLPLPYFLSSSLAVNELLKRPFSTSAITSLCTSAAPGGGALLVSSFRKSAAFPEELVLHFLGFDFSLVNKQV